MSEALAIRLIESPLGPVTLGADRCGLALIEFGDGHRSPVVGPESAVNHLDRVETELREYFSGERSVFGVPLSVAGTAFECSAWEVLCSIDYGTTISYGDQARRMGRPTAARAAGAANGRNRIPIVIPCHRVVAADGSLGGYSAGIGIKRWLLDHEQRHRPS